MVTIIGTWLIIQDYLENGEKIDLGILPTICFFILIDILDIVLFNLIF